MSSRHRDAIQPVPQFKLYDPTGQPLDMDQNEHQSRKDDRGRTSVSPPISRYQDQFFIEIGSDLVPMPEEMTLGCDDTFMAYKELPVMPEPYTYKAVSPPGYPKASAAFR